MLLPISALQHWAFCPRQAVLIHLERIWVENQLTALGRAMHARAHEGADSRSGDITCLRGLEVCAPELGLHGVCDLVERSGRSWVPVEYKRGRPKAHRADEIQVAAQAMCIEEMIGVRVPRGLLYYGATRRRLEVSVDATLRSLVRECVEELRGRLLAGTTPSPVNDARCARCSLAPHCLPTAKVSASCWFETSLERVVDDGPLQEGHV